MKIPSSRRPLWAILPLAVSLLLAFVPVAQATPLLTSAYETQLEAWLGQGNLDFGNLFTKVAGDGQGAASFHAATNGLGATFTLMEISGGYPGHSTTIIGGYNPDSWNSSGTWTMRLTEADRHAFLFNLTSGVKQNQNLNGQGWSGFNSSGDFETYNNATYGPTFGGGFDLTTSYLLESGSAYNFSFGGTSFGTNITGDYGINTNFNISRLEVYSFAPGQNQGGGNAVPETTATLGLLSAALLGMATLRRSLV